jgi:hypothetical protein
MNIPSVQPAVCGLVVCEMAEECDNSECVERNPHLPMLCGVGDELTRCDATPTVCNYLRMWRGWKPAQARVICVQVEQEDL